MTRIQQLFQGRHLLRVGLAIVFLVIGLAMGLNLLGLSGFGLVVLTLLFSVVGFMLPPILAKMGTQALGNLIEQVAIEVVRQLRHRLLEQPWQRFKRPEAKAVQDRFNSCPPLVLDTSAIIDGRIVEIVKTGFVHGRIIVPKFVLIELQRVADSSDRIHRERGRRGLDLLKELQQLPTVEVVIQEKRLPRGKNVDERLVKLAQGMSGQVVTTDYGLNKVAKLLGVSVLNVNKLANALRPLVIPGERLIVTVVQSGKEKGQGVGYFADGTMVVVEDGEDLIGQEIEVVVSRFLQTAAGRMVFAHQPAKTDLSATNPE